MGLGWPQILIVAALLILLFGRGRISSLMGDVASGITNFRRGLKEGADDETNSTDQGGTIIEGEASEAESDKK